MNKGKAIQGKIMHFTRPDQEVYEILILLTGVLPLCCIASLVLNYIFVLSL